MYHVMLDVSENLFETLKDHKNLVVRKTIEGYVISANTVPELTSLLNTISELPESMTTVAEIKAAIFEATNCISLEITDSKMLLKVSRNASDTNSVLLVDEDDFATVMGNRLNIAEFCNRQNILYSNIHKLTLGTVVKYDSDSVAKRIQDNAGARTALQVFALNPVAIVCSIPVSEERLYLTLHNQIITVMNDNKTFAVDSPELFKDINLWARTVSEDVFKNSVEVTDPFDAAPYMSVKDPRFEKRIINELVKVPLCKDLLTECGRQVVLFRREEKYVEINVMGKPDLKIRMYDHAITDCDADKDAITASGKKLRNGDQCWLVEVSDKECEADFFILLSDSVCSYERIAAWIKESIIETAKRTSNMTMHSTSFDDFREETVEDIGQTLFDSAQELTGEVWQIDYPESPDNEMHLTLKHPRTKAAVHFVVKTRINIDEDVDDILDDEIDPSHYDLCVEIDGSQEWYVLSGDLFKEALKSELE